MRKFMRTRQREPAPASVPLANGHSHKTNGHANGSAGGPIASRREDHSTLSSRYWSGSEWSGGGCDGEGEDGEVEGAPWEDPEFPASWRSIGDRRAAAGVDWMRPHELCARPTFMGCGGAEEPDSELFAQRWRVELGPLGDPHLCCAAGALALTPRLLARVAPPQQPHPARRYRFRFWVWGSWREVQVDDRLPCKGGKALGARSGAPGDFALPLLEKAYAKLYGSYRALRSGSVARALLDLSGGVVQALPLRRTPRALLARVLHAAVPRSTLLVASATRAGAGLAARRPYAVTGLARVRGAEGGEGETLLRLRAVCVAPPSPRPPLPSADCDLLAARAPAPGDFWMSLKEFCAAFSHLELVHVGPDDWMAEPALRGKRPWRAVLARRRWRQGYNAGGPPGGPHAHANPQFHVSVPRACRLVVSVAQQYALRGDSLRAVGFSVLAQGRVLDVTAAVRAREVVTFFSLPAGRYLVVPHTRRPHTDRAFLLRILTDERADVWEANEDNAVLRGVSTEMEEAQRAMPEAKATALARLLGEKDPEAEVDATRLRTVLARGGARCSAELCRALVALRDSSLRGCMRASELPALLALLAQWRQAYGVEGASSYRTRALLVAGGVCASNKVVECVVARWARNRRLPRDAYLVALARLHLAHERYRCLDAKLKSNPLSLEEMILMTIYS